MSWSESSALAYIKASGLENRFYSRYPNAFNAAGAGTWAILWLESNGIFQSDNTQMTSGATGEAIYAAAKEETGISQSPNYVMPFVPVITNMPIIFPPATPVASQPVKVFVPDEDDDIDNIPRDLTINTAPSLKLANNSTLTGKELATVGAVVTVGTSQAYTPLIDADDYSEIYPTDPTHRLVGRDSQGNNVYQLTDEGGHLIQWSVIPGNDSRAAINGTVRQVTGPNSQPSLIVSKALNANTGTDTTNVISITDKTNAGGVSQVSSRFDPTHIFVGNDANGNDVFQLIDEGGNLVEWAVKHGDDSRASIQSTVHYVTQGAPSIVVKTVAKGASRTGTTGPITIATAENNSAGVSSDFLKIAGAVVLAILTK